MLAGVVAAATAGAAYAQIDPNRPGPPPHNPPGNQSNTSSSTDAVPKPRPGYPSVYQQVDPNQPPAARFQPNQPPPNPARRSYPPVGAIPPAPPPAVGIFAPNYEPMGPRRLGQERARDAVRQGQVLPLGQVMPAVRQRVPGRVMDVNLQGVIYNIRMLTPRGTVVLVEADGRTGRVLNVHGRY